MGDVDSHLIHAFLGPSKSITMQHLDRFSRFCTDNYHCSDAVYWRGGVTSSSKSDDSDKPSDVVCSDARRAEPLHSVIVDETNVTQRLHCYVDELV